MANTERFETELPPDLAQFVRSQVGQGTLASGSDVLREAVRALEQREKLRWLRAKVDASLDDPRPSLITEEVDDWLDQRAQSTAAHGEHA